MVMTGLGAKSMNAEILAVGTELLLGDIVNTNARFLSRELAALGISVYFQTVVGDNEERLTSAMKTAFSRADIIIATGGLGPTNDDLTKEIAAKYFILPLVMDEKALERTRYAFPGGDMPESFKKQALIPMGATPLYNDWGTAPGCIIEKDSKIMILLPGPPGECEPMFRHLVRPYLENKQECVFVSKTLRLAGIGESSAAEKIADLLESQSNPTIAPYAKPGEVVFRITARAKDNAEAEKLIKPMSGEVYSRMSEYIYGENETTLEETVLNLLKENGFTLSTAESCTGGMLAAGLTEIPGSSEVFLEGCVTYSNKAKVKHLGVRPETLEKHGAVSAETSAEMAGGIANVAGTDISISITGIAGPGGGSADKPVGLVYISLYYKGNITTEAFNFNGGRQRIRTRAVRSALYMLWRKLREDIEK